MAGLFAVVASFASTPSAHAAPPADPNESMQLGAIGDSLEAARPAPATATAAESPPRAGGWYSDARMVLSAERLIGVSYWSQTTSQGGNSVTLTGLDASAMGSNRASATVYGAPRLALDFPIGAHVTVGGSASVTSRTAWDDTRHVNKQEFSVSPRVGYVWTISQSFAFWLRAGFTYFKIGDQSDVDAIDGVSFDLEPTFVFSPVAHVGLTLGGASNIPILGGGGAGGDKFDVAVHNAGLEGGISVWY